VKVVANETLSAAQKTTLQEKGEKIITIKLN
jgi:hypothetical protein